MTLILFLRLRHLFPLNVDSKVGEIAQLRNGLSTN